MRIELITDLLKFLDWYQWNVYSNETREETVNRYIDWLIKQSDVSTVEPA